MNVQIHAKGLSIHADTRAHIEAAIEAFKKYSLDITSVNVNLKAEKKGVWVEFDVRIAHAQPVVISQSDEDLGSAIDLAIERATKALRRLHDKVVSHKATSIKEMEVAE
ncbi:MAG: ribosome-associated translation inhibitor RaiA [Sulfurimonas sp.]|uniref:ribosome hibernation-promoting factor, HPF/YfiA family n=1 Tax=Sulfurimonas sp. TaxID=2022749 RepID=UPI0025D14BB2|nr:ribosome-associated translation inhibitor RaiA [Sulfurimonas sp.]MCK9453844.1 ribosome-associated translation inhibitor RaiA [Sulfurimonas sp.]